MRLYEDELTSDRRPTLAQGYALAGSRAPRADQGYGSTTARRIAACLDTWNGRLIAWQRAHFDRQTLLHFYQHVEQSYPQAEQIFLIHDNWPVHWHPELLEGLRGSKLTLVSLPTYSPWLNPVEKVWRQLDAEVLHLHPWVNAWAEEQAAVQAWLDCWADGSLPSGAMPIRFPQAPTKRHGPEKDCTASPADFGKRPDPSSRISRTPFETLTLQAALLSCKVWVLADVQEWRACPSQKLARCRSMSTIGGWKRRRRP